MVADFTGQKYKHGTPKLEVDKGKLRIRIPASLMGGKRSTLSLGLDDTPENRVEAEKHLAAMLADINLSQFDPTLERYRSKLVARVVSLPTQDVTPAIRDVWTQYANFRKPSVSPSTWGHQYKDVTAKINALPPNLGFNDGSKIRDYVLSHHSMDATRRFMMQLKAMSKWAYGSGIINADYFRDVPNVTVPKNCKGGDDGDIYPFTREERDAIIAAFESNQFVPKCANKLSAHSHYAPYVKFLFFTGCRPSEAIGLQWKHIKDDRILFAQSVVDCGKALELKTGLKTQNFRYLPINSQLRAILNSIKPDNATPDDFVFPSPKGGFIDVGNFRNRVWVKVLEGLGLEYRKPYQTRHTFITLCLESGIDAKDVAKWVGKSPEVIYKHYASAKKELNVPEL